MQMRDPLEVFFGLYTPFKCNRLASSVSEFRRLCNYFDWPSHNVEPEHSERDKAWRGFRIAMVEAFNATFGDKEDDIEAWGRMCALVGMESIPEGLEARRWVCPSFPLFPPPSIRYGALSAILLALFLGSTSVSQAETARDL